MRLESAGDGYAGDKCDSCESDSWMISNTPRDKCDSCVCAPCRRYCLIATVLRALRQRVHAWVVLAWAVLAWAVADGGVGIGAGCHAAA